MKIDINSWFSIKSWIYHMSVFPDDEPIDCSYRPKDFCTVFWQAFRHALVCLILAVLVGIGIGAYIGTFFALPMKMLLFTGIVLGFAGVVVLLFWLFDDTFGGAFYKAKLGQEVKEIYKSFKEKYCPIIEWADSEEPQE